MKLSIAKEHTDFFTEHNYIEVEELLSGDLLHKNRQFLDQALSKRLHLPKALLRSASPEALFTAGRDLWLDEQGLVPLMKRRQIGELAADFFQVRQMRVAFSLYLPSLENSKIETDPCSYIDFLKKSKSLREMSCIQGVIGGVLLCLHHEESQEEPLVSGFLPVKAGNGVFFHADLPMNFSHLMTPGKKSYLLIAYGSLSSVYISHTGDPHAHTLKKSGYSFGDRLKDNKHPIVIR